MRKTNEDFQMSTFKYAYKNLAQNIKIKKKTSHEPGQYNLLKLYLKGVPSGLILGGTVHD